MALTNEGFTGSLKAVTVYGVLKHLPEDQIAWLRQVHNGQVMTVRELLATGRREIIYNGKVLIYNLTIF